MSAIVKGTARQTTSRQRVDEGVEVYLNLLRDGTMSVASFKQACVMAGYGFIMKVQGADFSTGQAVDAGNVMVPGHCPQQRGYDSARHASKGHGINNAVCSTSYFQNPAFLSLI